MITDQQKEIFRNLNIEDVATTLGIEIKKHKAICFMHGDTDPSLSFKNNKYLCFGCKANGNPNYHGDVIALVQAKLGYNFLEACKWLDDNFFSGCNLINKNPQPFSNKSPSKIFSNNSKGSEFSDIYEAFIKMLSYPSENHYLVKERKIKLEVLIDNEIKAINFDDTKNYKSKLLDIFPEERLIKSGLLTLNKTGEGFHLFFCSCCAVFPFFMDGKIIYIQGLTKPELRNTGKSRNLTGIKKPVFYFPKTLFEQKTICIVEGIITALYLISEFKTNVIALLSADFPETSIEELQKFKEDYTFYISPDVDTSGKIVTEKLLNTFFRNGYKYHPKILNPRDFGRYLKVSESDLLEIKDLNDLRKFKTQEWSL